VKNTGSARTITRRHKPTRDGAWRQMLLKRAGVRQSDVARACGVPESTVSRVIAGQYPWTAGEAGSRRALVEQYVADYCGEAVAAMFPASKKERPRR